MLYLQYFKTVEKNIVANAYALSHLESFLVFKEDSLNPVVKVQDVDNSKSLSI